MPQKLVDFVQKKKKKKKKTYQNIISLIKDFILFLIDNFLKYKWKFTYKIIWKELIPKFF